jgi:endo-1,4-beta-xylanase
MVALVPLLFATASMVGAALGSPLAARQSSTPSGQGYHDGFYYYWWTDGASPATYTNGKGGSYSLEWTRGGNLLGGKGWKPGTDTR